VLLWICVEIAIVINDISKYQQFALGAGGNSFEFWPVAGARFSLITP
jgi:hypothetical protein